MDISFDVNLIDAIVALLDAAILWVLIIEYWFDRKIYEQKRRGIKRTKNKVRVKIEDGQVVILEKPKQVNVVVENE